MSGANRRTSRTWDDTIEAGHIAEAAKEVSQPGNQPLL
jgi:hypothetical protein